MKIFTSSPAAAPTPAIEEAAFPVEATTPFLIPLERAKAATRKEARSLKEPVGLRPSSFTKSPPEPVRRRRFSGRQSGVPPTGMGGKKFLATGRRSKTSKPGPENPPVASSSS